MDGYAAGSEAEAEEQQRQAATGPSEQPRNRRAKRRNGRQRQREAAWKNREAEHAAVMEDMRPRRSKRLVNFITAQHSRPNIQDQTQHPTPNTPALTCYLQNTPALTLFDLHDPVQVCAHLHVLSCEFGLLTQPGFFLFDGFARVTSAALYLPSYVAPTHQEGCGSYRRCTQRHLYQALYETILRHTAAAAWGASHPESRSMGASFLLNTLTYPAPDEVCSRL